MNNETRLKETPVANVVTAMIAAATTDLNDNPPYCSFFNGGLVERTVGVLLGKTISHKDVVGGGAFTIHQKFEVSSDFYTWFSSAINTLTAGDLGSYNYFAKEGGCPTFPEAIIAQWESANIQEICPVNTHLDKELEPFRKLVALLK